MRTKRACARLFSGGGRYAWEGPDSVRGNRWCLWNVAYALVPQCALYDGVAVGKGRLGSFLVIGGDGRRGVVFSALDDVESPDVESGVL